MNSRPTSSSAPGGKFEERCLSVMEKGTRMIKVRPNQKRFQRTFYIDPDHASLHYKGSQKMRWFHNMIGAEDMKHVPITEIQEVRAGAETDVLKNAVNNRALHVQPSSCFSVVIGTKHKTLDLVASSQGERDHWVYGLKHIVKKYNEADTADKEMIWIKGLFRLADKDNDKTLTFKEVLGLLNHLNVNANEDIVMNLFQEANVDAVGNRKGEAVLNEDEFINFVKLLTIRPELEKIYSRYNYGTSYWKASELKNFLQTEQFMNVTEGECVNIIQKYEQCPDVKVRGLLSSAGFYQMMYSPEMDILKPEHATVYQDMTLPMSDYFIDSSHNTYLLEDQLLGPSAVEAYIRALKRGCRCVELDCWDGADNEPVIYHGHTLTSKILFKDTVDVINQYAFHKSEYPVILSIENHCCVEQQRVMAHHMRRAFGDKLYTEQLPEGCTTLPSPEALKGRIVVKAKKLPPNSDGDVSDEDEAADVSDERVKEQLKKEKREKRLKLATELSDCVVICQSVSFKSFDQSREKYNFKQMSSFSEYKSFELVEKQPQEFIGHNHFQISRIYPGALRTDSSNYDPQPMWNVGAQIVALNYQTADDPMLWNMGRFIDNGMCGYVLKPDILLREDQMFNPNSKTFPTLWKKKISITIISGWQLPKEKGAGQKKILDPYVKLDVTGVNADKQEFKTRKIDNNGFNPVWDEKFEFEVMVPQLALLRFQVKDHASSSRNELVALYSLPVDSLQQGYRAVPLLNKYNESIWPASLLLYVRTE